MAHPWLWTGLFALVLGAIALDLGVHRHQHKPLTLEAAIGWSFLWIALSVAFGCLVWWRRGGGAATQFFTAYLLEKSLSFDNLLVFLVVFRRFRVPEGERHRVLTWGILGALVMRGLMIFGGVKLLSFWHPIIYLFGAFLAYSGVQTLIHRDDDGGKAIVDRAWVKALCRVVKVPPLLFVLIIIEISDLIFAVDSIPAVLGVSNDFLIVFSSNVLAVLGLRALYLVVEKLVARLAYLPFGIGSILILIGAKMCLDDVVHVPSWVALCATMGILIVTAAVSLIKPPRPATTPSPLAPAPRAAPGGPVS
ncbi:MAG: Integral rane protein TerC [Myxococcales bacterium]|nr:Integral rane protein TerC [Myxococcales bacterium]